MIIKYLIYSRLNECFHAMPLPGNGGASFCEQTYYIIHHPGWQAGHEPQEVEVLRCEPGIFGDWLREKDFWTQILKRSRQGRQLYIIEKQKPPTFSQQGLRLIFSSVGKHGLMPQTKLTWITIKETWTGSSKCYCFSFLLNRAATLSTTLLIHKSRKLSAIPPKISMIQSHIRIPQFMHMQSIHDVQAAFSGFCRPTGTAGNYPLFNEYYMNIIRCHRLVFQLRIM